LEEILCLEGVSFSYPEADGGEREALKAISFCLRRGELVSLVGASGAGKSTALQIGAALLFPSAGTVRRKAPTGLCLQRAERAIFEPHVGDDVAYGPVLQGAQGKELVRRVKAGMAAAGLDYAEYRDRLTYRLSGGERRKVALAGILALGPELYLFDEPTAALDPSSRAQAARLLLALRDAGKTVLYSTHDMELAALADRVLAFQAGEIAFDGPPQALFSSDNLSALGLEAPVFSRFLRALPEGTRDAYAGLSPFREMQGEGEKPPRLLFPTSHANPANPASPATPPATALDTPAPTRRNPPPQKPKPRLALPAGAGLRGLPPARRLLYLLLILVPVLISRNVSVEVLAIAGLCALTWKNGARALRMFRACLPVLPFIALFALIQVAIPATLSAGDAVLLGWGSHALSLYEGRDILLILGKLAAVMGLLSLYLAATPLNEVIHGVEALSPRRDLGLLAGLSLRFVPILREEADYIRKAQAARGGGEYRGGLARKVKAALSLTVPLSLRALERADTLSLAFEARLYPGHILERYQRYPRARRQTIWDALAIALSIALTALAVWPGDFIL
jgi:energy-coupling factor transport system ATP-binding protein